MPTPASSFADPPPAQPAAQAGGSLFATTHWSIVLSARESTDPKAADAMEHLCRTYWYPLYAYVRRLGHSPHDSQDLTQEFFARLLAKKFLDAAEPEQGRFRTFLLVALRRFLANDWDRRQTLKRGGGQRVLSIDSPDAESRYQFEPADPSSPDRLFERRWALTLVDQAIARLQAEWAAEGRLADFDQLKGCLTADRGEIDYTSLSAALGPSQDALRVAVHRLRKRFRTLFREEVRDTVSDPADIEFEMRHLFDVLSNP